MKGYAPINQFSANHISIRLYWLININPLGRQKHVERTQRKYRAFSICRGHHAVHNIQITPHSWRVKGTCVVSFVCCMLTSSNGNIFLVTGHLCGEFTSDRWLPRTKASDAVLKFSLIWAWINGWVNNGEAGDLRRHRAHYDVTVMQSLLSIMSMA